MPNSPTFNQQLREMGELTRPTAGLDEAEMIQPAVLDTRKAAVYLDISESYLRQARMKQRPPGFPTGPPWFRIGRSVKYTVSSLNDWLANQEIHDGGEEL